MAMKIGSGAWAAAPSAAGQVGDEFREETFAGVVQCGGLAPKAVALQVPKSRISVPLTGSKSLRREPGLDLFGGLSKLRWC
jgi:hypothetical protein